MALMYLFRAVGWAEMMDLQSVGMLRPGPPSFQGKWFAESAKDAARWGRLLYRFYGEPFYLLEIEVAQDQADQWFRVDQLDRIGPARFAEPHQLNGVVGSREIREIPVGSP